MAEAKTKLFFPPPAPVTPEFRESYHRATAQLAEPPIAEHRGPVRATIAGDGFVCGARPRRRRPCGHNRRSVRRDPLQEVCLAGNRNPTGAVADHLCDP